MAAITGTPDNFADWVITRTQDWREPLPTILADDGTPRSLAGKVVEVWVRPAYEDADPLRRLVSVPASGVAGIIVDDAAAGQISAFVPRVTVRQRFPAGNWRWFGLLIDPATGASEELWRGKFRVEPGEV